MKTKRIRKGRMLGKLALVVVAALLAVNAHAWQNPLQHRYLKGKPLEIYDQGSFFVGGVPKITRYAVSATVPEGGPPQQITIGHQPG